MIGTIVLGDVPANERRQRAADLLNISLPHVDFARAYYADHTDEIDDERATRAHVAAEGRFHAGLILTSLSRFDRAARAYPQNLARALQVLLVAPPVHGSAWTWWLDA